MRGDRSADFVRDTEFEVPFSGPGLRLIVLADLEKNRIGALVQFDGNDVLIILRAAVIDFIRRDDLSVAPDLERIKRRNAKLSVTRCGRRKSRIGVGDDVFFFTANVVRSPSPSVSAASETRVPASSRIMMAALMPNPNRCEFTEQVTSPSTGETNRYWSTSSFCFS